jgi:membrane-associated phospholipid phosphatase
VDRWVAAINAALALIWLPSLATAPLARWFVVTHLAALTLPMLLARSARPRHPVVAMLRELYPVLWLSSFWTELGVRYPLAREPANDAAIAALDARLFGIHWNEAWSAAMPDRWFSELMHGAYCSYYVLLVGVPALMLRRGCRSTLRDVVLRMAATYLACFVIYAAFPVRGPYDDAHRAVTEVPAGWFEQVALGVRAAGDALGTAFPSSHTAGAVTLAVILWRWGSAPVAWMGVTAAVAIAMATVYTGNHFPVDTLAGIAVALVAQFLVVPMLEARRPGDGRWLLGATPVSTA